jgi:hypothetical protein
VRDAVGLYSARDHASEATPDPNRPYAFKRAADAWIGHGVPPSNSISGPTIARLQFADQHCTV